VREAWLSRHAALYLCRSLLDKRIVKRYTDIYIGYELL
jgi:hypothetical protein